LPDLLQLVRLGAADAPALVREIHGKEALGPIEELLSRPAPRGRSSRAAERARLEKLRLTLSPKEGM